MTCILCGATIDLFDLDAEGWVGEPAHDFCAEGARQAWRDALDWSARQRAKRRAVRTTAA